MVIIRVTGYYYIAAVAVCCCCVGADSQLALHGMLSLSLSVVDGHFSLPSACIGNACSLVVSCCRSGCVALLFSLWMCVCVSPVHVAAFFSAGAIK